MTTIKDMLATYVADLGDVDRGELTLCIEECIACAQACTACADACLSEGMVGDLTKCIRTDMDCADICNTTASVLSRHTGYDANITRAILQACATACKACADECGRHSDMEHCRMCAEACRSCEQACNELLERWAEQGSTGRWRGIRRPAFEGQRAFAATDHRGARGTLRRAVDAGFRVGGGNGLRQWLPQPWSPLRLRTATS